MAMRDLKGAARLALQVMLVLALPLLPGCKEEAAPARQQAAAPPAAVFVARVERQAISRARISFAVWKRLTALTSLRASRAFCRRGISMKAMR